MAQSTRWPTTAPHERRPRTPPHAGDDQNEKPSFWRTFGGRFWALVLVLLALNYLSVAIFAPGREKSVTIPYTRRSSTRSSNKT